MGKSMMVRLLVPVLMVGGLARQPGGATAQHSVRSSALVSPAACFFLKSNDVQKDDAEEERVYEASKAEVYGLWCKPSVIALAEKMKAADGMATAWKLLWDRDTPFNAAFHESGQFDLLALLGVTHELPTLMRIDSKFTDDWVRGCKDSCFEFYVDPDKSSCQQHIVMIFRLVNDLRHNLKKEPASKPVLDMLYGAQFKLGD